LARSPTGAESSNSLCGGGFNSAKTSAAVVARHFPERRHHGTPAQRHESMNRRRAQKVSTVKKLGKFASFTIKERQSLPVVENGVEIFSVFKQKERLKFSTNSRYLNDLKYLMRLMNVSGRPHHIS
jgi:hypothetical protein